MNSYPNKNDSRRGSNRGNQMMYVPKVSNSKAFTEKQTVNNKTLSSFLRRDNNSNNTNTNSNSCEGRFVRYLPQDDAVVEGLGAEDGGIDPQQSQTACDLLNSELAALLRMDARQFWKTVATDVSLHEFLDSYLQFRRRWFDLPLYGEPGQISAVVVGDTELTRRVFMVLYRMSSNHDPGAPPSRSLSAKEHTDLLLQKKLLDIPKLLDICAIYGHDNKELTKSLVSNAIKSQPRIVNELKDIIPWFLNLVETMHQRCASALEGFPMKDDNLSLRTDRLHGDLLEVLIFLNDATATLDAFIEVCPLAAACFLSPMDLSSKEDKKELLPAVGILHDSLIPLLNQGFVFTSEFKSLSGNDQLQSCLKILHSRLVKFAWQLLHVCYLSQSFVEDNSHYLDVRIFPAEIQEPSVRGDMITQAISDMAFKISGTADGIMDGDSFLASLEKKHRLMSKIDDLCKSGWITLEDGQYEYLSQLVGHINSTTQNSVSGQTSVSSKTAFVDSSNNDEEGILQSKISQIRELFPDYGSGFLSACLDIYNNNPEEVIQRILEGTLHSDLRALDPSIETKPLKKQQTLGKSDKGKGKLNEYPDVAQEKVKPAFSHSTSCSSLVSDPQNHANKDETDPKIYGRYVRRQNEDAASMTILDHKETKDSFRSMILAAQYEDEYDDSFDELGMSVADSQLEENDDSGSSKKYANHANPSTKGSSMISDEYRTFGQSRSYSTPLEKSKTVSDGKGKWKNQQKPQFYMKDGKNYSYKVSGSIPVSSAEEAESLKKIDEETIHGLGAGGNVPLRMKQDADESSVRNDNGNIKAQDGSGRGRGMFGRGGQQAKNKKNDNHHRKDRAMKKHFSGVGGY